MNISSVEHIFIGLMISSPMLARINCIFLWFSAYVVLSSGHSSWSLWENEAKENITTTIKSSLEMPFNTSSCSFPESEFESLKDLYMDTGGKEWNWDTSIPGVWNFTGFHNPCTENWQRLFCSYSELNESCHVVSLGLSKFGLKGSLPVSIGNLSELTILDFNHNLVTGGLPQSITQLRKLAVLTMYFNSLTGTIPGNWSALTDLLVFDIGSNKFHGPIPLDLSGSLRIFDIKFNRLEDALDLFLIDKTHLQFLAVESNNLYGSFPQIVGNLSDLIVLNLAENFFFGTIGSELFANYKNLSQFIVGRNRLHQDNSLQALCRFQMLTINVADNLFTGTVPDCFGQLTELKGLYLGGNEFDESYFPLIPNLVNLRKLDLYKMNLIGELPSFIGNFTQLSVMDVSYNNLEGEISSFNALRLLKKVILSKTFLSGQLDPIMQSPTLKLLESDSTLFDGTIPESICNDSIVEFYLSNNYLSGTLPNCIGSLKSMTYFSIGQNNVVGTIPPFSNGSSYNYFAVYNNQMSGMLPDVSAMSYLEYFFVQNNSFTGSISFELYSNETVNKLEYVDVSTNILTGTLPSILFERNPHLVSFSAASNCMSGSIPESICTQRLKLLDLDGMGAASSCQERFFPNVQLLNGYKLRSHISGGIPECLFTSQVTSLHLSGNAIHWQFPENFTLSRSLDVLSLSHNGILGTIPVGIQENEWKYLDLSYNKLNGLLSSSFVVLNETYLHLEVNRLSGNVPSSFHNLQNVSVLTGNMFECSISGNSLPVHDPDRGSYQCGSNSFNASFGIWGGIVFATAVAAVIGYYFISSEGNSSFMIALKQRCMKISQLPLVLIYFDNQEINAKDNVELHRFHLFLVQLRWNLCRFTAILVVLCTPVYVILTRYFYTFVQQYAWTVSAAFLSGIKPAVALLILWIGLLMMVVWRFRAMLDDARKHKAIGDSDKKASTETSTYQLWLHKARIFIVVLINCSIIILINGVYVYIVIEYNSGVVFVTQILLALFKLFWNDIAIKNIVMFMQKIHFKTVKEVEPNYHKDSSQDISLMSFLVVFNTIIAPLLANAVVEPQCFQNVFIASQAVTGTIPYVECNIVKSVAGPCELNSVLVFTTTYTPPFIYSYQCSSSFVANYASVYVFMFLFAAFVPPMMLLQLDYLYNIMVNKYPTSIALKVANSVIYRLMKPVDPSILEKNKQLFRKDRFILRIVGRLAVFWTFGVVFPPLAVVILLTVYVDTYFNEILIGRYLTKVKESDLGSWMRLLGADVRGSDKMLAISMLNFVLPFTGIFYGFFLIDIYGDNGVGYAAALWCAVLIAAMPLVLRICFKCAKECTREKSTRMSSRLQQGLSMRVFRRQVGNKEHGEHQVNPLQQSEEATNTLAFAVA